MENDEKEIMQLISEAEQAIKATKTAGVLKRETGELEKATEAVKGLFGWISPEEMEAEIKAAWDETKRNKRGRANGNKEDSNR